MLLRDFFSFTTSFAFLINPVNCQVLPLNSQCLPLNCHALPLIVRSLLRGVSTSEVLPLNCQCLPLIPLSACHFWRSDPTIKLVGPVSFYLHILSYIFYCYVNLYLTHFFFVYLFSLWSNFVSWHSSVFTVNVFFLINFSFNHY